jgi:Spy/CpxP family protein refolding chaperone
MFLHDPCTVTKSRGFILQPSGEGRREEEQDMIDLKLAMLSVAVVGAGAVGVQSLRAHGYGGHFGGHGRHGAMMHKFIDFAVDEKLDEIGATDAQKQKVREIKERLMAQGHALHADKQALREQVLEQLSKDQPDVAQLKAIVHGRIDAFEQFADEAADALVEIHGVLTPEQRQKLLADAREHMEHHRR